MLASNWPAPGSVTKMIRAGTEEPHNNFGVPAGSPAGGAGVRVKWFCVNESSRHLTHTGGRRGHLEVVEFGNKLTGQIKPGCLCQPVTFSLTPSLMTGPLMLYHDLYLYN